VTNPGFILASGSASRQAMLTAAGVPFTVDVPRLDEESVRDSLLAQGAEPRAIADALAELKAVRISARHPNAVVLGSDQVLVCETRLYGKADSLAAARATLSELRGRKHRLISAAVLAQDGKPIWRSVESADLWMRGFSDAFLDDYLAQTGDSILGSVGCYHIEGRGLQLFSRIAGDAFVIRGLPLLSVLDALRVNRVLSS
jgi:septum formation protein